MCLSGFDKIYACTHYNYLGEQIDYMPYDICSVDAHPVLKEIDGWNEDLTGITELNEIPAKLQSYIDYLEAELGTCKMVICRTRQETDFGVALNRRWDIKGSPGFGALTET
jgi:adenylosuccinate synthase